MSGGLVSNSVSVNGVNIGSGNFTVIAGPCSIESETQFSSTAQTVLDSGSSLVRGGLWKLRTSPNNFQGLGEEAFTFVRSVLKKTGLGLVTEITDPRQVEKIDDFVSMYQVGARNMYNYPMLQELGRTKKPILLKRSFSALFDEWIKAAEYITGQGNKNVILCERGIRTFETSSRFTFDLNSVLLAKARTPYPVLVDPSHAIGLREFVPQIAFAAAAVGADGIIAEMHPQPEEALSDGRQSLTFDQYQKMMLQLKKILQATGRDFQMKENTQAFQREI
jgi:3-deoxy-7-phosphoheptulonate synthase